VLSAARFTGTGSNGPNSRTEIIAEGSYLKVGDVTAADAETRLPNHPVPAQREWKQVSAVLSSSGMTYHVQSVHSAADEAVEIRVRGADGNWSTTQSVSK
jgi:hypothetical protein